MGRRDVHRDEDGSLRADYSGPAADPAACYIHMIVVTYSYIGMKLAVGLLLILLPVI